MKNSLVRAARIAAVALPLTLPTLAAAGPVGSSQLTAGRQPVPKISRHSAAAQTAIAKSSWIDRRVADSIAAGTTPVVYAALTSAQEVAAYTTGTTQAVPAKPVETIAGLAEPASLAVDRLGNLYVLELLTNDVKVFKPGNLTPFETLVPAPGSGLTFLSVAVDAHLTVYVATSTGSIAVYAQGATTPSKTLSDPAILSTYEIAVDGAGNIFLNYVVPVANSSNGYALGAVPAVTSIGETFFHRLNIDSAPNSPQPLGFTVDKTGNMVVADTQGVVSIYHPATNTPALSFQAAGLIGNVFNVSLALTGPKNHHLLLAPQVTTAIYEYAYPSGSLETTIVLPAPTVVEGLATSPAPSPGVW